jgi:hypothetical protein
VAVEGINTEFRQRAKRHVPDILDYQAVLRI